MTSALRFLVPVCSVLLVPLACSTSPDDETMVIPPNGGSASQAGTPGSGGATAAGTGGSAAATGGSGGASLCAETCPKGGFCKMGTCACPSDKQDICADSCVSKAVDPDNCGECGTKCDAGAACVAGLCGAAPTDLSTAAGCGSIRLALQGTNIYWTETMSGKINSMPAAGGAVVGIATGQLSPTQIATDAGGVYWVNQGDATAGSSKIMMKALPLAAGEPVELKAAVGMEKIFAIAVRANTLYYTLGHDVHAISTTPSVADDIVGTATNYDLDPPLPSGEPAGLAVDDALVFWTTDTRQGVERDDIAPGITGYTELGESQGSLLLADIASDGTNAYWANGENLVRAKADTKGGIHVTAPPDFDAITAFAINATDVYFGAEKGLILKHVLVPAEPEVPALALARDQLKVSSVVLDAANVYWASDCSIRSSGL